MNRESKRARSTRNTGSGGWTDRARRRTPHTPLAARKNACSSGSDQARARAHPRGTLPRSSWRRRTG
ncbi:hypothetical protein GUJ93_ZPchr0013g37974 [Zizania palustris]|uniref:Uncharacterized protein n=1 Tax=Zizania palustris TaxID=103762 RepID=A0A8J5X019_ZIZPA|nr:hypothetical protein GUJ93_ZPchr0013g37974 [Zizania palustris]